MMLKSDTKQVEAAFNAVLQCLRLKKSCRALASVPFKLVSAIQHLELEQVYGSSSTILG